MLPCKLSTTTSSKPDGADYEPDEEWKLQLRKRIEEGLQSMVVDAEECHAAELRKAPDTPETRRHLEADYKQAMQTIKSLATQQYQLELNRERNQRRWTAGVPMTPGWTQILREEQQNIMNRIKTDNSARTASESPTEERRSAIPKPGNEPPAPAPPPVLLPVPPSPSARPTEEREKPSVSPQSVRRGSDARSTLSRDRDEHPGSFRRSHRASVHERPALPENWVATDTVEEPEKISRPLPPRERLSSIDRPSQPSPVSPDKQDSSLGRSSGSIHSVDRHVARSPPKHPPEVRKPAISPAEDPPPIKTSNLGRRGSVTSMRSTGSGTSMRSTGSGTSMRSTGSGVSMRSTGSGASIRPSITETIPERADDDGPDESAIEENDYERTQEATEQGKAWISMDKLREKEKQPRLRRNSRQSSVDAGFRSDETSSLRSVSSSTIQYATSPPPNGPLSAKPSLTFIRHHPNDTPGKPPPRNEHRDQTSSPRDIYSHRDQQFSSQDQPSARPIPRSSYSGDDRDYSSPYSTLHRSKPPSHPQRESRPISRQASFTHQPYIDIDECMDDERGINRGGRDRERYWDREDRDRDHDGGRNVYSEPRRATTYPYSVPRQAPYPNPQLGGPRPASQDYIYNDFHDDRSEGAVGPSHGRYNYRNLPPDDWEYQSQRPPDSARPIPSRQPSFIRPQDDHDRRFSGENDGYSPHYSPPGGIPVPRHISSLEEPTTQSTWRDWAADGNRLNHDYHQQAPNAESFSHPRFTQPRPSYHNSPHDDHPSFGGREMDSSHRTNDTAVNEYDSDSNTDSEDDDSSSEDETEVKRRDLEAKRQKLEEERREADDELMRTELELQQLASEEARKKREEEEKRNEVERKKEEARKREEEVRRKEADLKKKEEEAAKKEAEAKRREREAKKKEQDAKKKVEAAKRTEDEARRKAEELKRKEEETKQRAAQAEADTEKAKQMQLEAQKIAEDLKKKEEEARKKDMEMKQREDILRRREEELMRREADNLRKEEAKREEEEAKKKEEEAQKEETRREEEEAKKKEEEAQKEETRREELEKDRQKEQARKEEVTREEVRKRQEARQRQLEDEEAKKKAAEAKRKEDLAKRTLQAKEAKHKADEAAKRREEDARQEEARLDGLRREQEEKHLQNESQHIDEMLFDLDPSQVDPKLMDEQLKVLQQAEFRKREEDIRRTREERKRNDSVGNDSAWSSPSYLSGSPGTSPGMSRTSHFNGPSSWGAGPASAWGPSVKPTAASSPTANRSSASVPTVKPRTGSVSSGTYPTSGSPHTASFSEAERARKQQEFAESQQEQFRRTQEKMEAERQLKGRLPSREDWQHVFKRHEVLWSRLSARNELSWNDFPWPMAEAPLNPDDMSLPLIGAYIRSSVYPDKDKPRTIKDRIKEHIKKWHPDRFETKLLPKVVEDEREKVKHGAGTVARYLGDLLRKENE